MRRVKNTLPLEVRFRPEGKIWIAEAPDLGVITQGETYERAEENLCEALVLFVQSCLSRGVFEQVFREAGFSPVKVKAIKKAATAFVPAFERTPDICHA